MIWTWIVKGGPVMVPILFGSVLGFAILFERVVALYGISLEEGQACGRRVLQEMRQGRLAEAISATRKVEHPVGPVLQRGLEQWGQPLPVMERAMEQAAQLQVRQLERWLGGLASVVTVEPMLGFLGTITGLIRAFMAWETAGARVTVSQLAAGIYEAMITTAAGLIIAIPLLMAHNLFVSRIKRVAGQLADAANDLLDLYARLQSKEHPYESSLHSRVPAQS